MARELTRRERMALERVSMREQDASQRRVNFEEVNLGYTAEMAVAEAERCLLCARPTCIDGCPVGIDIREFIRLTADGEFLDAADVIAHRKLSSMTPTTVQKFAGTAPKGPPSLRLHEPSP